MTEQILGRLFEHSNWANLQIIEACSYLSDEQLDAHESIKALARYNARAPLSDDKQLLLFLQSWGCW